MVALAVTTLRCFAFVVFSTLARDVWQMAAEFLLLNINSCNSGLIICAEYTERSVLHFGCMLVELSDIYSSGEFVSLLHLPLYHKGRELNISLR